MLGKEAVTRLSKTFSIEGDHFRVGTRRLTRARYPEQDILQGGDLQGLFERHIANDTALAELALNRNARFFTIGSCFAERIAAALKLRGISVGNFNIGETVNSTFANREFLEYALGRSQRTDYWSAFLNGKTPGDLAASYKGVSAAIYTLGVAAAFFHRETGAFTPHNTVLTTRTFEDHVYRMTSVDENIRNLEDILAMLVELSPDLRLILTVSPVPLASTFERDSAIVADCVSKSVLRVAAEEFCKKHPDRVVYWPSFEMIKRVSPHREPFYGTDDGYQTHIADEVVKTVVDAFIHKCMVE